jgi:hypothetical protein
MILHAVWRDSAFLLHLGHPYEDPRLPTWGELVNYFRLDLGDTEVREKFFEYFFNWRPFEGKPEPKIKLSAEISGVLSLLVYEDNPGFQKYMKTPAVAYRYLKWLLFDCEARKLPGEPLGEIQFIDKHQSQDGMPHVLAKDLASLACLQYCMDKKGENTWIQIINSHAT